MSDPNEVMNDVDKRVPGVMHSINAKMLVLRFLWHSCMSLRLMARSKLWHGNIQSIAGGWQSYEDSDAWASTLATEYRNHGWFNFGFDVENMKSNSFTNKAMMPFARQSCKQSKHRVKVLMTRSI